MEMNDITQEMLDQMKNVDILMVAPNELTDIQDIHIDSKAEEQDRIRDFMKQIGNPYCFKCGDYVVKIGFAETEITLTDRIKEYIDRISSAHI